ncbi:hypothetical protein AK830_g4291 [Neonectria ditissima]|uniref:Uncharacterized protein n=1 Tax=Neonectria ditissima TaxID=78410 RepID=A0A0N8H7N4_9HYPO|nr:hypothetical protein AK830_g4291 [Neonectria ditissima]
MAIASTEVETAIASVRHIAVMSDAKLAQFMRQHRLPNGDYHLPIDRAQKRSLAQSPTACFRLLDLDDLEARLRQIPDSDDFALRPETQATDRSRSPTPPFDHTRDEIEAYHDLIDDGGRPSYPIYLIRDVLQHPDDYTETLRPWQECLAQIWAEGIFQRQLQSSVSHLPSKITLKDGDNGCITAKAQFAREGCEAPLAERQSRRNSQCGVANPGEVAGASAARGWL